MNARVSATARLVAAGTVLEARDESEARLPRACLALDRSGRKLLATIDAPAGRVALRLVQALALPRVAAHWAWRKRRIARWAHEALAAGARQVLILGAGWDGLGARLARLPAAPRVIELDAPATLALKRAALARFEDPAPLLVDADLARDDPQALLARVPGFDPDAPTLVVAEGLLMYLERERVVELCAALRRVLGGPMQLIATAMSSDVHRRPRFRRERPWVCWWLGAKREPFRWGIERCELPGALMALGFTGCELARDDDPGDPDPSPGEWVFRAAT